MVVYCYPSNLSCYMLTFLLICGWDDYTVCLLGYWPHRTILILFSIADLPVWCLDFIPTLMAMYILQLFIANSTIWCRITEMSTNLHEWRHRGRNPYFTLCPRCRERKNKRGVTAWTRGDQTYAADCNTGRKSTDKGGNSTIDYFIFKYRSSWFE